MGRNGENKNQFVKADDERQPPEPDPGDDWASEFDWCFQRCCSLILLNIRAQPALSDAPRSQFPCIWEFKTG